MQSAIRHDGTITQSAKIYIIQKLYSMTYWLEISRKSNTSDRGKDRKDRPVFGCLLLSTRWQRMSSTFSKSSKEPGILQKSSTAAQICCRIVLAQNLQRSKYISCRERIDPVFSAACETGSRLILVTLPLPSRSESPRDRQGLPLFRPDLPAH